MTMLRLPDGIELLVANDDAVRIVRDGDSIDPTKDKILKVSAANASPLVQTPSTRQIPWASIGMALVFYHYLGAWGVLLYGLLYLWAGCVWTNTKRELDSAGRSARSSRLSPAPTAENAAGESTT